MVVWLLGHQYLDPLEKWHFFFFAQISTKEDYSEYFITMTSDLPLDSNSSALVTTDSCHNYPLPSVLPPKPHPLVPGDLLGTLKPK